MGQYDMITHLKEIENTVMKDFKTFRLYQGGSDWRLYLTTIEYNGASVWADLEYVPSSDGKLWFEVTTSGEN